jgi:hypothetical protein
MAMVMVTPEGPVKLRERQCYEATAAASGTLTDELTSRLVCSVHCLLKREYYHLLLHLKASALTQFNNFFLIYLPRWSSNSNHNTLHRSSPPHLLLVSVYHAAVNVF